LKKKKNFVEVYVTSRENAFTNPSLEETKWGVVREIWFLKTSGGGEKNFEILTLNFLPYKKQEL
jgi:hypothetical protein